MEANTLNLPVLALRGLTVFPHTNLTFDVERRISIKALEVAMESGQEIFLVTQRELNTDRPGEKDLYTMGTISRVTQILRLGKTSLRVMVEGGRRARLRRLWQTEPYLQGHVEVVEESRCREPRSENRGPAAADLGSVPGLCTSGRQCGRGGHRHGAGLPGAGISWQILSPRIRHCGMTISRQFWKNYLRWCGCGS